jgi:Arc/MetJ-type ribon-helix-helix transcriptional regulator
MSQSEKEFTTVSIPTPLFHQIEERIKGTDFTSVSSYVAYVLHEVVSEEEEETQPFSKEDEEKVKARLRALGYLD